MEENHFVDAIDDYEDDENVAETEAEESEIDEMLFGDDFEDEKLEIRKRYRNDETIRLNNFDLHSDSLEDRKKSKMLINYFMTDDNSLLIKNISVKDQANYTCGVYNVAGVRYSEPASLIISVNGEWSNWGDWSPCQLNSNLIEQGIQCGIGTQKRIRHCNNPSPVNNGEFCHGESIQVSECNILCPPIEGLWSSWTQWSICSQDCTQIKKRICKNLSSQYGESNCIGQDFMIQNCSGGLCRKTFGKFNDDRNISLVALRHSHQILMGWIIKI
ncbi:Thrombospondin repeats protein [Sarcoptes scabiei]|uniref:Thrombospondin repeats protein n=1 Tax=Sarcoptes scabiei TaxID=52283 RepID=A0A132AHA0_SARSC|nr:Thrombospondin repeats protein [Sarcoptes scabiei]